MLQKISQRITELGRLTPMGIVAVIMPMAGSALLILFLSPISLWLRENWYGGIGVVLIGTVVFCGLALLPTNVIGLLSGWAFGFPVGLLILIVGTIGASVVSFTINSRISGDKLACVLAEKPRLRAIHTALLRKDLWNTTLIVFLLRVSVIMPFAFTNLLLAASRVNVRAYIAGTALGHLPRASAVAFLGSGLSEFNLADARDTKVFAIGVVLTITALIVIGILSRKALERVTLSEADGV